MVRGVIRPDNDHDAVCASRARHILVTAPPGTGKTFLTIRLAKHLAPQLPPPAQVLVLTFSNQARTQLEREATTQLPPAERKRIVVTNYHRFFWHSVNAYRRALGLPMTIDIGSRSRRLSALQTVCDRDQLRTIEAHSGLIDSLAEHMFPAFHDDRTPGGPLLARLLPCLQAEHEAGRLVFDDLGALFWQLIESFPTIDTAYRTRFPAVIVDEHQDASALQDAVARRFGNLRLVVFADPMQLIHSFRGATEERLRSHERDCQETFSLTTPHRWHGQEHLGDWLLAVRHRLAGAERPYPTPQALTVSRYRRQHGFNAAKAAVRYAVLRAFGQGAATVAVLARENSHVTDLQRYLCRQQLRPRQIGNVDFEEARSDIEQLPEAWTPLALAERALARIGSLVPTLDSRTHRQVQRRLGDHDVDLNRAGQDARRLLDPLRRIYHKGAADYFGAIVAIANALQSDGHHVARPDALHVLRQTADAVAVEGCDLNEAVARYAAYLTAASHAAPRAARGLFVMTAHQAKGKEFDCVVIADASARAFPDDDDSRRLFYVAITRATARWEIIAPDADESPLVRLLT